MQFDSSFYNGGAWSRWGTVNLNGKGTVCALAGGVALCRNLSTNDNTEHGVYANTKSSISCTSAVSTLTAAPVSGGLQQYGTPITARPRPTPVGAANAR